MKRFCLFLTGALLLCGAAFAAFPKENRPAAQAAQVTLTVTKFRSWMSPTEQGYVDATTSLASHAGVRLTDEKGMPTLRVKGAVDFEIAVESADPAESYRPLAIMVQQQAKTAASRKDHDGRINFAQWHSNRGTLILRDRFVHVGDEGEFEFFVVIQRASDGAIGIIDPAIRHEPREP